MALLLHRRCMNVALKLATVLIIVWLFFPSSIVLITSQYKKSNPLNASLPAPSPTPAVPPPPEPKIEHPNPWLRGTPFKYYNPTAEKLNFSLSFDDEKINITDTDGKKLKVILFWNDFHGNNDYEFGLGRKPFIKAGCRVNTCVITADRNRYPLSQVDALIWHAQSKDKSVPRIRFAHTKYIFYVMEPSFTINEDLTLYRDVFNMTFTYRKDADIYYPYDTIVPRPQPLLPPPNPVNYASGRTKVAAWFVSNCHNEYAGRNDLVKALQRWIPVDVYGKCGDLKCTFSNQSNCSSVLERDYKFYLAFESYLCKDFVTYKMFRAMKANVIPVVWGLANYSDIAPPMSYINGLDFPSAYELAKYINYLNKNDTAYNEYFTWKRYYQHLHPWFAIARPYCDLCEKLHQDLPTKSYDIDKWYRLDANCVYGSSESIQTYINVDENLKL